MNLHQKFAAMVGKKAICVTILQALLTWMLSAGVTNELLQSAAIPLEADMQGTRIVTMNGVPTLEADGAPFLLVGAQFFEIQEPKVILLRAQDEHMKSNTKGTP